MDKIYRWRMKSLMKGCDPVTALNFIENISTNHDGKITPYILLDESRVPNTPLHNYFQWNNTIAAEHYRLQQARMVLNNLELVERPKVIELSNGKTVSIDIKSKPVYEIVTSNNVRGYKNFERFDLSEIEFVKKTARNSLQILWDKLNFYDELSDIAVAVLEAIRKIDIKNN